MNRKVGREMDELAAACVRGASKRCGQPFLAAALTDKPLEMLTAEEKIEIIRAGKSAGIKTYRFKTGSVLPRVQTALGFLRGVGPESLLDVGSGRGAFLFPFLCAFPGVPVDSVDLLEHRVEFLDDISRGGVHELTARVQDICSWDAEDKSYDVVTLLEVLEHIPDVEQAVRAAVRLARRYVLVTVPSKPDDNPEHIHLLTRERLTELFEGAGCRRLSFQGLAEHLFMAARIE